ncbi:MAG: beta-propeller repeat [Flavipsychrobacter sp.]|jgi:DNA-binding beta-propeller fold protein YncE|nr:beta-propeller repeat [Flavipsychrobacter sp.]
MRFGLLFIVYAIYVFAGISVLFNSCTHESKYVDVTGSNYPNDIAAIILNKCAVSGCHNNLSYANAGGLNLTTWDNLFKGTGTGATVIPYRPDFSSLCFFTNTDSSLGIALKPTMPYDRQPLSKAEYLKIRDWITAGAPDASGNIKFADDLNRSKFYVANRLCDVVTVIDAASILPMRYIDVGDGAAKYPYCIKVAPDKKHWYVSFFTQSDFVQQFNAENDKLMVNISLGTGVWTSFVISSDSKYGWFVDNSSPGKIVYVDLVSNAVLATYTFGGNFKYPSGIVLNEQYKKLYVGAQTGNFIYTIDIADPLSPVIQERPIDGKSTVMHQSSVNPVELLADPQSGKCYIACIASRDIRVMDMRYDTVVNEISLYAVPACMVIASGKLFVSCPDDMIFFPGNRGCVVVIDLHTNAIVKRIKTGYQPYGLAVDDDRDVIAAVNANISAGGPASHHVSGCGSKNGNVTFIDVNTLELVPGKLLEVAVFPYSVSAR